MHLCTHTSARFAVYIQGEPIIKLSSELTFSLLRFFLSRSVFFLRGYSSLVQLSSGTASRAELSFDRIVYLADSSERVIGARVLFLPLPTLPFYISPGILHIFQITRVRRARKRLSFVARSIFLYERG